MLSANDSFGFGASAAPAVAPAPPPPSSAPPSLSGARAWTKPGMLPAPSCLARLPACGGTMRRRGCGRAGVCGPKSRRRRHRRAAASAPRRTFLVTAMEWASRPASQVRPPQHTARTRPALTLTPPPPRPRARRCRPSGGTTGWGGRCGTRRGDRCRGCGWGPTEGRWTGRARGTRPWTPRCSSCASGGRAGGRGSATPPPTLWPRPDYKKNKLKDSSGCEAGGGLGAGGG